MLSKHGRSSWTLSSLGSLSVYSMSASSIGRMMAAGACSLGLFLQQADSKSWKIETVDLLPTCPPMTLVSLVLDDERSPHLVYFRDGNLVHAYKEKGEWTSEVVDSLVDPEVARASSGWTSSSPVASIAAGADRIHIVYTGSPPILKHAVKFDGRWSKEIVDERASGGSQGLSLVLDDHNDPHVSYCGYPSHRGNSCSLKHAFMSAGVWHNEMIDSTSTGLGRTGAVVSALAMQGSVPHIVTMTNHGFQYTLRYASKETGWFIETITEDGGEDVAMSLDSQGRPHVAWAVENVIRHAWRSEEEWRTEQFSESAEPTWSIIDVAVDAQDKIHVVHVYEDGVRHLVRNGTDDWEAETVDPWAAGGGFPFNAVSMVLDDEGQPHIAYVGRDELLPRNRFLRYAYVQPSDAAKK